MGSAGNPRRGTGGGGGTEEGAGARCGENFGAQGNARGTSRLAGFGSDGGDDNSIKPKRAPRTDAVPWSELAERSRRYSCGRDTRALFGER
jgi:hypothetical protein